MFTFSSTEVKRVLLWYVLYFFGLKRLNWMKKDPPGVFFGVFRLSKCENTNWACTSSSSLNPWISDTIKHYSLFSSSLLKNEERSELTFMDSLKFNREGKEKNFSWFLVSGSMSFLNIAPTVFSNTHVSLFTFGSAITSSFYSSSCQFYLGNMIMSPRWLISLVVLPIKLKYALGHLCVMLTIQGFIPASDLYPDPIIFLSYITCVSLPLSSS